MGKGLKMIVFCSNCGAENDTYYPDMGKCRKCGKDLSGKKSLLEKMFCK